MSVCLEFIAAMKRVELANMKLVSRKDYLDALGSIMSECDECVDEVIAAENNMKTILKRMMEE